MAWTPINTNDFEKSYYAGATDNELGTLFNANYGQVRHYLTDRYQDTENPLARRGTFTPTENIILDDTIKDLDLRVLKVVTTSSKTVSVEDICNMLDVSPKRLTESLVRLKMNHYTVNAVNGQLIVDKPKSIDYKIYTRDLAEGKKYKFGISSDQHLGSKYEREDVNEGLYDAFEAAGVTKVLNTGNWIEGEARFNKNDILVHGMGNQVEYFVNNYPKRDGIKTLMIAGDDHEGWYWQQSGIDIGAYTEMACKRAGRDDIEYLGYLEADVLFGADNVFTKVRLMHPGGGSSYAVSYKPQKIVESISIHDKPDILIIGHYHKSMYMQHQGVHVIQAGTTKDQDLFMRKHQLAAHIGGWIVEFTQLPDGSVGSITTTWIPFDANHWKHIN